MSEKKGNETVEKRTFAEETTQPLTAKIYEEKMSKEPIITSATTDNSENEPPIKEISVPEITTNTVLEVTTAVEQIEKFDISYWISYAQNYAQSIGFTLEKTATECWDNPISANANSKNIGADIESRLNRYKNVDGFTSVWIWAEKLADTQYELYIGYA